MAGESRPPRLREIPACEVPGDGVGPKAWCGWTSRPEERAALATWLAGCPVRRLKAGQRLLAAGEPNAAVYLVLEGRLREQSAAPESDPIAVYGPGEIAGVVSALAGLPAAASLSAETETRVRLIEAEAVWFLAKVSHAVARALLTSLVESLRRIEPLGEGCHQRLKRAYERHRLVDELTGLRNRRGFENALARLAARCAMSRDRLSVILLRIEAFQDYRRRFGDTAAEAALYTVARALEESLRPTDLLARYGEQEFAVALPYTDRLRAPSWPNACARPWAKRWWSWTTTACCRPSVFPSAWRRKGFTMVSRI